MLLRKHLESATITAIEQVEMDRIIKIKVDGFNELFDRVEKTLVIEMMGRYSNIILLDENNTILDALKRINRSMSRVREVLPGGSYTLEGIVDRTNPLKETKENFIARLHESEGTSLKNFFIRNYLGISPLIAREIAYRAGGSDKDPVKLFRAEDLYGAFHSLFSEIDASKFRPQSISDGGHIIAFSAVNLTHYPEGSKTFYDGPSALLDHTFSARVLEDRVRQKSQNLNKQIKNHLERALHKQEKMEFELRDAKDRQKYKVYGDLISSNAWKIERGAGEVTLENFYDDMNSLTIPLDETKDGIQNAAHYYKKYTKLKHAEKLLAGRIEKNRNTIRYLDAMLYNLDDAESIDEVDAIQEEFREDFLKKKYKGHRKNKKKKKKEPEYLTFTSSDGFSMYVGRNNRQNQELTLKFARKDDLWFHVKNGPGSHVIVKTEGEDVGEATIYEGAALAAYYSRARQSAHVDVDYTKRQFIRRHPSNQPGLVLYTDFSTVAVTPEKEIVDKLKTK